MQFRQFSLDSIPMSQGELAKAIAQQVKAYRILAVGDAIERFSDEPDCGGLVYVRVGYNAGEINMVEVVIHDLGSSAKIWYKRAHKNNVPGDWEYLDPNGNGKWEPTDFTVTGITVEDYDQSADNED